MQATYNFYLKNDWTYSIYPSSVSDLGEGLYPKVRKFLSPPFPHNCNWAWSGLRSLFMFFIISNVMIFACMCEMYSSFHIITDFAEVQGTLWFTWNSTICFENLKGLFIFVSWWSLCYWSWCWDCILLVCSSGDGTSYLWGEVNSFTIVDTSALQRPVTHSWNDAINNTATVMWKAINDPVIDITWWIILFLVLEFFDIN